MKIGDALFGIHADALKVRGQRTQVLASNIANADTPGFKARDIDFRAALAQVQGNASNALAPRATQAGHIGTPDGLADLLQTQYRVPLQPTQDGNTVDLQMEQAAFAENAVRYQATLMFINSRIAGLRTAITGD